MTIIMLLVGLAVLVLGAELLVRGASRLGLLMGISPLVVGLTIVAFGTSSPELAVCIRAALTDHADIVLGTNIGSTNLNILFILGLCALVAPLKISQQLIWYEVPIMVGAHVLLLALCFDGQLTRWNGFMLVIGLVSYVTYAIIKSRRENQQLIDEYQEAYAHIPQKQDWLLFLKECSVILAGLILCVYGAGWLLESAVTLSRALGVSELIIGITIVAAGTSLPEIATSVVATIRGERDIAVGNVVGSCIFNIFGIVGISALVAPEGINVAPSVIRFDLPVAISACVACLPIFFTGHSISRWEGGVFFFYYVAYTLYLVLDAKDHDVLPVLSNVMMWFVIPLTLVTVGTIFVRELRKQKDKKVV